MITEDYLSFEVAKLLKEKGFDVPVNYEYHYKITIPQFHRKKHNFNGIEYSNCSSEWYSAPTLQMAMKWLREVHNIHIELNWDKGNQLYSFQIWKPGKFRPEISSLDLWKIYKDDNYLGEWIYEEATEAALKYSLENLI